MARPETHADIKPEDRFIPVGNIETERFLTDPVLLKAYQTMLDAIAKAGGEAMIRYGTSIELKLPRNKKQLDDQLRSDQYAWDDSQKEYNKALRADISDPVQEYKRDRVKEWAKSEGLPDPFDVFAANDEELQKIRSEMGLNND